ncbi:hypothetical protein ACFQ2B_04225 [Streptomyces stramineus]
MTDTTTGDDGWRRALVGFVPVPAAHARPELDASAARHLLRCTPTAWSALTTGGLTPHPTADGERFDSRDLFNLAVHSGSRASVPELALSLALRFARQDPRHWARERTWDLELTLTCPRHEGEGTWHAWPPVPCDAPAAPASPCAAPAPTRPGPCATGPAPAGSTPGSAPRGCGPRPPPNSPAPALRPHARRPARGPRLDGGARARRLRERHARARAPPDRRRIRGPHPHGLAGRPPGVRAHVAGSTRRRRPVEVRRRGPPPPRAYAVRGRSRGPRVLRRLRPDRLVPTAAPAGEELFAHRCRAAGPAPDARISAVSRPGPPDRA